jgi:DNA repair ATPase RecN|tara:strand:+ start:278 stop:916 length:639 start_codon:yes stop_codon:yes gene_type:complete
MNIDYYQNRVTTQIAQRDLVTSSLDRSTKKLVQLKERKEHIAKATIILQDVAKQTQKELEYHLGSLVTLALNAVFPDPPEFVVKFELRRGQTECDLLFREEGEEYKPIEGSGGGPMDVASFALRVAFWSLNRNSPVLVLDEPMRNLSPDLHEKAGEMIKDVSKKLGLQIIMVSHSETINFKADKIFVVKKRRGIATVKVEGEENTLIRRRGR